MERPPIIKCHASGWKPLASSLCMRAAPISNELQWERTRRLTHSPCCVSLESIFVHLSTDSSEPGPQQNMECHYGNALNKMRECHYGNACTSCITAPVPAPTTIKQPSVQECQMVGPRIELGSLRAQMVRRGSRKPRPNASNATRKKKTHSHQTETKKDSQPLWPTSVPISGS